ncbi:MAG TPA: hypothetical protein VGN72_24245 [Tepidisphaeraceae bacterium]|jgi:hypothetical protein|nr:hypothetical protein [Tepidisphaeraceae bacterium]
MNRITTAAAIVLGLVAIEAHGGTAEPVADSVVQIRDIGKPGDLGTQKTLAVKSDNPAGQNDRIAVLRFDLAADKPAAIANPTLTLHLAKTAKSATSGTFELYGVTAGAAELTLDEAAYAGGGKESAVDASGNRLQEKLAYDADPDTKGVQPIATATLADGDAKLTFVGEAMKVYIDAAEGGTIAFIVMATKPAEKAATPAALFHAREAEAEVRPTLSWE